MAHIEFFGQRLSNSPTAQDKVTECFSLNNLNHAVICVAFARFDGVQSISGSLRNIGNRMKIFVGINNGITSAQALAQILEFGNDLYAINTGNAVTFHPKLYYATNDQNVRVVIGSSNLTNGGLCSNIEFCSYSVLTLSSLEDRDAFEQLERYVQILQSDYPPANVFPITSIDRIRELLNEHLLEDENHPTNTVRTQFAQTAHAPSHMMLPRANHFSHTVQAFHHFTPATTPAATGNIFVPQQPPALTNYTLIWESGNLTERDLNIPSGRTTNPTGSMGLKKGNSAINHLTFFRHDAFSALAWQSFTARNNVQQEEAFANFRIVIMGNDYGSFILRITHDPRTNTRSYQQNNMMTHLHWGNARPVIADRNLLGCLMRLYRDANTPPNFLIEIS